MRRNNRRSFIPEEKTINLTSLIDVLFVLLIAFMIPSQYLFGNLTLEIPNADAEVILLKKNPIKVFIDRGGKIIINGETEANLNDVAKKIDEVTLKDRNVKIYVFADKMVNYGHVVNIVGKLNENNFSDVVLITDLHNRIY